MKIYILTRKNSAFIQTFQNFDLLIDAAKEINVNHFDGENFMTYGKNGTEPYLIDSIVLCKDVDYKNTYTLFYIRCIDSLTGELCEL